MRPPIIIKLALNAADRTATLETAEKQNRENQLRAEKLHVPVRYSLFAAACSMPERVKDDQGNYATHIKEIRMPKRIFPARATTKALDTITLRHEIAEAEALNRGNALPIHTHIHPSVLREEIKAVKEYPKALSDRWYDDLRLPDILANVAFMGRPEDFPDDPDDITQYPVFEQKIMAAARDGRVPTNPSLEKAYHASKGQRRSFLYRQYIEDMLNQARGQRTRPDDQSNAYLMFNDLLTPSLRYDPKKEKAVAEDIAKKSLKTGLISGGVLGLLGAAGAGAYSYRRGARGSNLALPVVSALVSGAALGGPIGSGIRQTAEIEKHYFQDEDDQSKKEKV